MVKISIVTLKIVQICLFTLKMKLFTLKFILILRGKIGTIFTVQIMLKLGFLTLKLGKLPYNLGPSW